MPATEYLVSGKTAIKHQKAWLGDIYHTKACRLLEEVSFIYQPQEVSWIIGRAAKNKQHRLSPRTQTKAKLDIIYRTRIRKWWYLNRYADVK